MISLTLALSLSERGLQTDTAFQFPKREGLDEGVLE